MPRAAGDSSHYTFTLKGAKGYQIKLPSVTSIIGAVMAKPALVGWAYKTGIKGTLEALQQNPHLFNEDYDIIKAAIHEAGLSTTASQKGGADRGTEVHGVLEALADGAIAPDDVWDASISDAARPYAKAVVQWWEDEKLTKNPDRVLHSEQPVWSLKHGFAGTLDHVREGPFWVELGRTGNGVRMTDLKTGSAIYPEASIQLSAYKLAWEEMHPDQPITDLSVLLAKEDGTYEERVVDYCPDVFLHLLEVYKWMKGA